MERHTEIVRQWRLLLALEGKSRGMTLSEAQTEAGDGVSDRTIRRDFEALTQAGFPIETAKRDGKTIFLLNREVFRGVAIQHYAIRCQIPLPHADSGRFRGEIKHLAGGVVIWVTG